jgi:magnesium transporter
MKKKTISALSSKINTSPGSLLYIGDVHRHKTDIQLITYNPETVNEFTSQDIEEVISKYDPDSVNWININGLHDVEVIERIGMKFGLHPLLMEDILNTHQIPKVEDYDDCQFFTLKMLLIGNAQINREHVCFVLGRNFIISFNEKSGDYFDQIKARLITGKGRSRKRKADYLYYLLIDRVVDNYYLILESIAGEIEETEDKLVNPEDIRSFKKILSVKRKLIEMRKEIFPLQNAVGYLINNDTGLIENSTLPFLKDIQDHVTQVTEIYNSLYETIPLLLDLYNSNLSNRLNSVMKTLTVVATIFIPLTFIVGFYGMNFKYMPEIYWKWSYPVLVIIMIVISVFMVIYIKKKKWE